MRDDAVGMFWQTLEKQKADKVYVPRTLPPIPETGWKPVNEFPDLSAAKRIAIDVETFDPDLRELGPGVRRDGYVVGLAVGTDDGFRRYYPIRHQLQAEDNLSPEAVMAWARVELGRDTQPKVGANILYDCDYLEQEGVAVRGTLLDVQVAEPLLDENRFTYSLDSLAHKYFGESKVKSVLEEWARKAYGNSNFAEEIWRCPPSLVGPYGEGDVDLPLRILEKQERALAADELTELWDIETGVLPMLLAMRRGGVRIDLEKRAKLDDELTAAIDLAQARLNVAGGGAVNVNAARDLARLFDRAGVHYPRTALGNPSFIKEWLEHHEHPAALMVTEVRSLTKLRDTFVRGFLGFIIEGRIHTLFHSSKGDDNGTVSGRFSSSLPNLQNIPIRDPIWGPKIRSLFIPEDGCEWVKHDWSQIEYRFLAHFGIGPNARAVQEQYTSDPDTDFHKMVLELVGWGAEMRRSAKVVNFGLVYGMGEKELARRLGVSVDEATETVFNPYHSRVPFVKDTYNRASSRAQSRGYVRTIMGRRAHFEQWGPVRTGDDEERTLPSKEAAVAKWGSGNVRRQFTHKALNRVLQGSAADLMKKAMRDIWQSGVYRVLPVAHLTVHDELGHSKPRGKAAIEAIAHVKHLMEAALKLRVPIIADEKVGTNWGTCE